MSDDYIDSYQRWQETTTWDSVKGDKLWAIIALNSEVGELSQLVEKSLRKGTVYHDDDIMSEVGDILWNVSNILNEYDLKLSDCMKFNIDKIERRRDGR